MDQENIIMELLVHAGSARSHALSALRQAREGDFAAAEQSQQAARAAIGEAHRMQTTLIGMDEGSGKLKVTLILAHAQDHLMNAMLIQDLTADLIELYRRLPAPGEQHA
ncbi:PTS lactose/cellobiose transporter subunit IIA [Mixta intestinalis]|uniref:PTS system N,N'-diacetylchitobiose-specific EIIA component n=1 Tax=Mixta intestinalis TaxID=1615494 RepID=A0A6P1Q663_9GAMM|nr:PTS lactose/cellobiose transporter subunit IIA [Mixta intestinalis]QHM73724.1 PTS system N,N'-diacetylchitobiose-specific EIIA component [Mixta intestinalis]